ncbi:MAG: XdhC family protein, partial [Chloroflexi bacterium]|nr:XdhC family protein [Chloroflexota bacterium]
RAAGIPFCLATVVRVEAPTSGKPGDKAVITADGKMIGWIGGSCSEPSIRREAQLALAEGSPRLVRIGPAEQVGRAGRSGEVVLGTTCPSGGTLEIFIEPHLARPQLIVIGRSPAARTLIRLAALVGFRTCGVHLGATSDDFPDADGVLASLELGPAGVGPDSWIVVATMGHYDEEALEAALATDAAYVGLVASRRRRNAIVQALRGRGWPGDALAGIVNPAGRMLGDAQEEIALSILADIVGRRNRRKHRTLPAPDLPEDTAALAAVFATDPICGMAVEVATARFRSGEAFFCSSGCLEAHEGRRSAT